MKVLVTGASGFIGRHLIRHYVDAGATVIGWSRQPQPKDFVVTTVDWRVVNMLDPEAVAMALKDDAPEVIFHLSAQCLPRVSWQDPVGTFDSNVMGTINLLEAMKAHRAQARLVLTSSSAIYAPHPGNRPIQEDHPTKGASLYAVSKLAQEMTVRLWGRKYDLTMITVRPFFVIGPEKRGDVCADFAQRVVRLEREGGDVMRVGNLEAVRDFLDIADAVSAFTLVAEKGKPDEVFNIARGSGWAVRDVLETYRSMAKVSFRVEVDQSLVRRLDEPVKIGDPARLTALGWSPRVPIEEALERILNYWRQVDDEEG